MEKNRGFSLLELLIVAAMMLVIVYVAIPALLRSRQAANESRAVANLKTVNAAEASYSSSTHGSYGTTEVLVNAGLLDSMFRGTVSGYSFTITSSAAGYTAAAAPVSPNTGRYDYYTLPDGVVRYSTTAPLAPGPTPAGTPVK